MPMKWKNMLEIDLWFACLHEAGHTMVARHLGDSAAHFLVWPNPDRSPRMKSVLARTFTFKEETARNRRLIGLAGAVATYVHGLLGPDWADAADFIDLLEGGMADISATDLRMADGYDGSDVEACIELVCQLWPSIIEMMNTAYENYREVFNEA